MFEIIPIVPYMIYVNENRKNFKKNNTISKHEWGSFVQAWGKRIFTP